MGEDLSGEGPGARAEPRRGSAAGNRAARPRALAKSTDRHLAVTHGADDDGWHFGVDEEDLRRELDHLVEQSIGAHNSGARRKTGKRKRGYNRDPRDLE